MFNNWCNTCSHNITIEYLLINEKKNHIIFFFFLVLFVFYFGKFYNKENKTETVLPEIENIESSNLLRN